MKKRVMVVLLIFLSGCAADSELLSVFSSGQDETRVPVVYPAEQPGVAEKHSTMVNSYGASWENISEKYPEYTVN